ncbi:MAG: peptidase S55, partial [Synergistaceae bacterium]|nr:peptidase S55 [Synergistaceae bacterium]
MNRISFRCGGVVRSAFRLFLWVFLLLRFFSFISFFSIGVAGAAGPVRAFIPEHPVLSAEKLRTGMKGYMLTVLKGTKPVRLPIEVVSVIPQKEAVRNFIMIRMLPSPENKTGLAQGMSGSPVYVGGKLVGAVGIGWNFSDHRMALVTPIEEMCGVFSRPDKPVEVKTIDKSRTGGGKVPYEKFSYRSLPLMAGGLSDGAAAKLKTRLNVPVEAAPYGAAGELSLAGARFLPGEAVILLLAWGDVEIGASGTVTATSKDGRFLAFGHPFLEWGAVNFPAARAYVHETVSSQAFPFKIASPVSLAGTATQDRPAGVGGKVGYFTPSMAATLVFKDTDLPAGSPGARVEKNFRVAPDAFLGSKLLQGIYEGLIGDLWGRRGEGTATVTLRVEGHGLTQGWTRTNVFVSDSDVGSLAMDEPASMIEMILLQPFEEVFPIGFKMEVTVTQKPKVLYIEDVAVSSDAKPGEKLNVEVTLRPWRRKPVKKRFEVVVPKDAAGNCELVVRGGGANPLSQVAVDSG